MSNGKSLFQKIDEFLFKQIEVFQNSTFYAKYMEMIGPLGQEAKKFINQSIISFIFIVLPLSIVIIYALINWNESKGLKLKTELYTLSQQVIQNHEDLKKIKKKVLAKSIGKRIELNQKLKNIANSSGIDLKKLNLIKFNPSTVGGLNKVEATIDFKDFSIIDLTKFFKYLIVYHKLGVAGLSITKDNKQQLKGKINIFQYSDSDGS